MKARANWFLGLLLACGLVSQSVAAGKPQINWVVMDFPPQHIVDGPFKGQGYMDVAQKIIEDALPEYEHIHHVTNTSRMYRMAARPDTCASLNFRNARLLELRHFTPSDGIVVFANEVQILARRRSEFGREPTVSLEELLSQSKLRMLISSERSYDRQLDAILARHKDSPRIEYVRTPSVNINNYRMLAIGRGGDYTLGFPVEAAYFNKFLDSNSQFVSIPIREQIGLNPLAPNCSKNDFGKSIIAKIEPLLHQRENLQKIRGAYERWLDPDTIARYRALYESQFHLHELPKTTK